MVKKTTKKEVLIFIIGIVVGFSLPSISYLIYKGQFMSALSIALISSVLLTGFIRNYKRSK